MNGTSGSRPRVSRETRLLLATVVVSLVALSLLARLRFPEEPVRVGPVPPLLTQLAPSRPFDELAADMARLEALVLPTVDVLPIETPVGGVGEAGPPRRRSVPAFRFRDDRVFALAPAVRVVAKDHLVLAEDPGAGLVVLARPPLPPAPFIATWAAERTVQSRYLVAAIATPTGPALHPVFVGPLNPVDSPTWSASVWRLDTATALEPGMLLFTTAGAFAGVVAEESGGTILVPAPVATAAAERLLQAPLRPRGTLGIDVQALPPAFAAAAGVSGVVVSWVDPEGPSAELIASMDIIESIESVPTPTLETWRVRHARLAAGDEINLRIRRDGVVHAVTVVTAAAASPSRSPDVLGITLRPRAGAGADVVSVEAGSIADRAGLRPGDVITHVGNVPAPTPAHLTRAFADLPNGGVLLAAVTRGDAHTIVELVKP